MDSGSTTIKQARERLESIRAKVKAECLRLGKNDGPILTELDIKAATTAGMVSKLMKTAERLEQLRTGYL